MPVRIVAGGHAIHAGERRFMRVHTARATIITTRRSRVGADATRRDRSTVAGRVLVTGSSREHDSRTIELIKDVPHETRRKHYREARAARRQVFRCRGICWV